MGFGLANDETGWPPEPFAAAFAIARDAGLFSVPHAGELAGPASVVGALDALGAHRIQHGVRAVEDRELVRRLADSGVCLDVCPSSNVMLSVVPAIEAHPCPTCLRAGVRCSLNADDPLLFGPNLLDEYKVARAGSASTTSRSAGIARSVGRRFRGAANAQGDSSAAHRHLARGHPSTRTAVNRQLWPASLTPVGGFLVTG